MIQEFSALSFCSSNKRNLYFLKELFLTKRKFLINQIEFVKCEKCGTEHDPNEPCPVKDKDKGKKKDKDKGKGKGKGKDKKGDEKVEEEEEEEEPEDLMVVHQLSIYNILTSKA